MKRLDFKNFQKQITPELYSFAFALIPDDLQATQLIIDATTAIAFGTPDVLRSLYDKEVDIEVYNRELYLYKLRIYREVYELARKRSQQLSGGIASRDHFTKLPFTTRASLFLKYKSTFTLQEIGELLSVSEVDLTKEIMAGQEALV